MRTQLAGIARSAWVVVLLLLAAPFGVAQAQEQEQLKAADKAFCEATAARGLEGWLSFFASDTALPLDQTGGHAALRRYYKGVFAVKDLDFKWGPERAEVFPSRDLDYTVGRYTKAYTARDGRRVRRSGSYITVWRRQEDGSWKIIGDFGAPDSELPKDANP